MSGDPAHQSTDNARRLAVLREHIVLVEAAHAARVAPLLAEIAAIEAIVKGSRNAE